MKTLNIFFPEWQGYGEDNRVQQGATILKEQLSRIEFEEIQVPDREDLPVENQIIGYHANLRQLKACAALLRRHQPERTFLIGGTCASEIAPVSWLNSLYGEKMAVLWFDAHGDLNTPESSPSKHFHGMPLRTLLGDSDPEMLSVAFSTLKPDQVYVAGGRDIDPSENELIGQTYITLLSPDELRTPDKLIDSLKSKGFEYLYIHVDLDVLAPEEFEHLLLPVPQGVKADDLLTVLEALREQFTIAGSSIVEYVPKGEGDVSLPLKIAELIG